MRKTLTSTLTLLSVLGLSAGAAWAQDGAFDTDEQDSAVEAGQPDDTQAQQNTQSDIEYDAEAAVTEDRLGDDLGQQDQEESGQQIGQQDQQESGQQQAQSGQQEQSPQVVAYNLILEHDDDNDVTLNQEEFENLYQQHIDQEGDQVASQLEARFTELDKDENAVLSSDELAEAMPVEEDAQNLVSLSESSQQQQAGIESSELSSEESSDLAGADSGAQSSQDSLGLDDEEAEPAAGQDEEREDIAAEL